MTTALFIFLSLFHTVSTQAGAVSAGGLQAPPRVECLFLDPANPTSPRNFMAHGAHNGRESGVLVHVDLLTRGSLSIIHAHKLKSENHGPEVSFRGEEEGNHFRVAFDRSLKLAHSRWIGELGKLSMLNGVSFVEEAVGYRASLSVKGESYVGICAEGPLFYYSLGNR